MISSEELKSFYQKRLRTILTVHQNKLLNDKALSDDIKDKQLILVERMIGMIENNSMTRFSVYANNPTWSLVNADLERRDVYNLVVGMYNIYPCEYIIKETDIEGELVDLFVVSSKERFERFKEKYAPEEKNKVKGLRRNI